MVDIYILMGLKRKLNRICIQLSRIFGVLMIVMTMRSGKIILKTIQLFSLTSEQKYHYTQMKLVGQTYWWWKDIHIDYQCRFVLENHLCTFYASHFLYAPEVACKKPNVEQELELEKSQLRDLVAKCKEILASARKLLASYVVKVDPDSEPLVLVEPDIFDEAEPKVVEDSKPVRSERASYLYYCRSSSRAYYEVSVIFDSESLVEAADVYEPLQIYLQKTELYEISLLMMQSIVCLVFTTDDSHLSATCDWLDLPSFTAGLPRKPISPPPPWFNHDASVLIL